MFNGQEVNYLFRGTHHLSSDYPRHRHTKYAINYLENRYVGKIEVKPFLATQKMADDLIEWKVKEIVKVSGEGNMVIF